MEEKIRDSINRYKMSLDSYKHNLMQWTNRKNNTHGKDSDQIEYWTKNIEEVKEKIRMIEGFLNTLHSFID